MKYSIKELREIACIDQGEDDSRPWVYTSNCHMCGGVGAFIEWLEADETLPKSDRHVSPIEAKFLFEFLDMLIENDEFGGNHKSPIEVFSEFCKTVSLRLFESKAYVKFYNKHEDMLIKFVRKE